MFSKENSKLCFEMLEMNSASQNHLPLQGARKRLQSRRFIKIRIGHRLVNNVIVTY